VSMEACRCINLLPRRDDLNDGKACSPFNEIEQTYMQVPISNLGLKWVPAWPTTHVQWCSVQHMQCASIRQPLPFYCLPGQSCKSTSTV